jgi:branched-chain amino acid aminotransferase
MGSGALRYNPVAVVTFVKSDPGGTSVDLPRHAYFKGKIVPYSEAKVGVATHALNYGTAVFGGMRGYWNDEKKTLFVFRPLEHYQRFLNSCRVMLLEINQTPESLTGLTLQLLRQDAYQQNIYIRPLAYKADEVIGVRLHNLKDDLTIFALPFEQYIKNDTAAHVTISSWRRIDDNTIPARGKISGAYASSALIKTDAAMAGFDEALVLTQDGHLTEGSAMNIFMLRDGVLVTPPVTDNILEGITRRSVMELVKNELRIPVLERPIDRSEIYICDEFFLTGTAAQITVVTKVDHRPVGKGVMGPVADTLCRMYDEVLHGNNPKYAHWVVAV